MSAPIAQDQHKLPLLGHFQLNDNRRQFAAATFMRFYHENRFDVGKTELIENDL